MARIHRSFKMTLWLQRKCKTSCIIIQSLHWCNPASRPVTEWTTWTTWREFPSILTNWFNSSLSFTVRRCMWTRKAFLQNNQCDQAWTVLMWDYCRVRRKTTPNSSRKPCPSATKKMKKNLMCSTSRISINLKDPNLQIVWISFISLPVIFKTKCHLSNQTTWSHMTFQWTKHSIRFYNSETWHLKSFPIRYSCKIQTRWHYYYNFNSSKA